MSKTRDQKIALGIVLPFDITKQTVGAQKAYKEFVKFYGKQRGTQIYLQKAEEQGTGRTIREKVNSIYRKGAKLDASKGTDKSN